MSETTPNSSNGGTPDACEQLLDYVYGELDDARKRAFEEHLAGCARCQAEAASFGRVRAAVKRVMPAVEPSGNVNGALHAQLMHAAAQRKPRRGVLLSFPRKVMQHPAWAMAAMFTVVGGAIAINWSSGKMAMPAAESVEGKPSAAAPAVAEPAVAEPAKPEAALEKKKVKEQTADAPKPTEDYKIGGKGGELAKVKDEEASGDSVKLDVAPAGKLTVQRPAPHRATATPVVAKEAAPKTKKVSANNGAKFDDLVAADGFGAQDKGADNARQDNARQQDKVGGLLGATSGAGGAARGAPSGAASAGGRLDSGEGSAATKSSAPDTLSRSGKAELQQQATTRDNRGYASSAQPVQKQRYEQRNAPAQAPPPPPAATVPASPSPVATSTVTERDATTQQSQGYYRNKQSSVQSPAGPTRETESLRKKADEAAKANRCDEAIKLYQELDKLSQYITPTERLNYVRCLNQKGRQDEALKRLDELKNDKRITNSELQKVENEISDSRRRQEPRAEKKAPAKKPAAAPADRAAEKQQQRAVDSAPAEAAPPAATDTKVQKPAY